MLADDAESSGDLADDAESSGDSNRFNSAPEVPNRSKCLLSWHLARRSRNQKLCPLSVKARELEV